jgi:hypothetical protein
VFDRLIVLGERRIRESGFDERHRNSGDGSHALLEDSVVREDGVGEAPVLRLVFLSGL